MRKSKKVPALTQLMQYKGKENIFISFTALDKIGINPYQTVAAGTPYGIYSYNLDMVIEGMEKVGKASEVAAKGDQPYIWVLECCDNDFIHSPASYTEEMFQKDLKNIKMFYLEYCNEHDYMYMGAELSCSNASPFEKLITMTKEAAKDAARSTGKNMPLLWNKVLRHLGYTGMTDDGTGVIHPNEPIQTVFFSKKTFKVVDKIYNTEYDGNTTRIKDAVSPSKETKAQKYATTKRLEMEKLAILSQKIAA